MLFDQQNALDVVQTRAFMFATMTGYRKQGSADGLEGRLCLKQTKSMGSVVSGKGRISLIVASVDNCEWVDRFCYTAFVA